MNGLMSLLLRHGRNWLKKSYKLLQPTRSLIILK
jgi:hypothetical protein